MLPLKRACVARLSHKTSDRVSSFQQSFNQVMAYKSGRSGNKHVPASVSLGHFHSCNSVFGMRQLAAA
jgi:hypothetical protein